MVAVFSFGAAGAALATVLSQAISVLVSYHLISNRPLPFAMTRAHVTFHKETIKRILSLGIPLAVQDLLSACPSSSSSPLPTASGLMLRPA